MTKYCLVVVSLFVLVGCSQERAVSGMALSGADGASAAVEMDQDAGHAVRAGARFLPPVSTDVAGDIDEPQADAGRKASDVSIKPTNVALGKAVTNHGATSPQYRESAARLTDGNIQTRAFPGAFSFDYTLELTRWHEGNEATGEAAYDIDEIVIHWGKFGRHFPGAKRPDGSWVPAAYKGDYVNRYCLRYRTRGDATWHTLHKHVGLPTTEDDAEVIVTRLPADATESQGDVITALPQLGLKNVTALRIDARGAHWIGLHEFVATGRPSDK